MSLSALDSLTKRVDAGDLVGTAAALARMAVIVPDLTPAAAAANYVEMCSTPKAVEAFKRLVGSSSVREPLTHAGMISNWRVNRTAEAGGREGLQSPVQTFASMIHGITTWSTPLLRPALNSVILMGGLQKLLLSLELQWLGYPQVDIKIAAARYRDVEKRFPDAPLDMTKLLYISPRTTERLEERSSEGKVSLEFVDGIRAAQLLVEEFMVAGVESGRVPSLMMDFILGRESPFFNFGCCFPTTALLASLFLSRGEEIGILYQTGHVHGVLPASGFAVETHPHPTLTLSDEWQEHPALRTMNEPSAPVELVATELLNISVQLAATQGMGPSDEARRVLTRAAHALSPDCINTILPYVGMLPTSARKIEVLNHAASINSEHPQVLALHAMEHARREDAAQAIAHLAVMWRLWGEFLKEKEHHSWMMGAPIDHGCHQIFDVILQEFRRRGHVNAIERLLKLAENSSDPMDRLWAASKG